MERKGEDRASNAMLTSTSRYRDNIELDIENGKVQAILNGLSGSVIGLGGQ